MLKRNDILDWKSNLYYFKVLIFNVSIVKLVGSFSKKKKKSNWLENEACVTKQKDG